MNLENLTIKSGVRSHSSRGYNLQLLWQLIKQSYLFVIFWFINALMPIAVCLISASVKQYGAWFVLGIGYITAFQLAYVQIGWVIAITVMFFMQKKTQSPFKDSVEFNQNLFHSLMLTLMVGFVTVVMFVVPTYLYTYYANKHVNTIISQQVAFNYILGLIPYIFFNLFLSLFIIDLHLKRGSLVSIPTLIGANVLMIGLTAILGLVPTYKTIEIHGLMIGMGLSIGAFISVLIVGLISYYFGSYRSIQVKWDPKAFFNLTKYIFRHSFTILTIQIIKGFALLILGFVVADLMLVTVPLGFQLSRIVWYNMLYLIPFIAYGLADTMMFVGLRQKMVVSRRNYNFSIAMLVVISVVMTSIVAIICYFLVEPIAGVYVANLDISKTSYFWSTVNFNDFDLQYTYDFISKKVQLGTAQKIAIETAIKFEKQLQAGTVAKPLIPVYEKTIKTVKETLITMITQQGIVGPNGQMLGSGIAKYLDIGQKNYAFLYISLFGVFYPSGLILKFSVRSSKGRYDNWIETIILILLQILVISSVVAMGIKLQSVTGQPFQFLDAWSFPLALAGPLAMVIYIVIFAINNKKMKKQSTVIEIDEEGNEIKVEKLLRFNQWNTAVPTLNLI